MKKNIFIFLLINLFIIDVNASTTVTNYVELSEEVINYSNDNIDILITIPTSYNDDIVSINTKVFDSINHFRLLDSNNKNIRVNIIINNESNYIYKYNSNSIRLYITNNNMKIYRSNNNAIKSLYNNKNIKLDDKTLNNKLKSEGYSSLEDYYIYYYNNKYKTNYTSIYTFNNKIKKDIFKNTNSNYIETNNNINKLSINYFNNSLVKLIFNNRKYSIEECLNYYIDDSEYIYYLNNIFDKGVLSFNIELDKNYNDLFKNYLKGSVYFTLSKTSTK